MIAYERKVFEAWLSVSVNGSLGRLAYQRCFNGLLLWGDKRVFEYLIGTGRLNTLLVVLVYIINDPYIWHEEDYQPVLVPHANTIVKMQLRAPPRLALRPAAYAKQQVVDKAGI